MINAVRTGLLVKIGRNSSRMLRQSARIPPIASTVPAQSSTKTLRGTL